jgi:hypothetical protein
MNVAMPSLETTRPAYSRIVLKLSGESLQGAQGSAIDAETVARVAAELKEISEIGVQAGEIYFAARAKNRSPSIAPPPIIWACWPP